MFASISSCLQCCQLQSKSINYQIFDVDETKLMKLPGHSSCTRTCEVVNDEEKVFKYSHHSFRSRWKRFSKLFTVLSYLRRNQFEYVDERNIIEAYFWDGFSFHTIVRLLSEYHGFIISVRTLRRRLADYNLKRRSRCPPLSVIFNTVQRELQGPGRLGGYRSMWRRLHQLHHMLVPKEVVRNVLLQIDPMSVAMRRQHRLRRRTYTSRGPNDTWHVDGYDKLRPYGFLISGCIDGYSRKLIWLRTAYSNHKPGLIASYFVDSVTQFGGYPCRVRTDCGTENVMVAAIQSLIMGNTRAHIYGTSPGNQRIEAWWSFFRRNRSQFWIELFESVVEFGAFHPGCPRETELLRFCFMPLLQEDLDEVRRMWNTHRIRPSVGARCPPGIPDELFYLPQLPAVDCLMTNHVQLPAQVLQGLERARSCEDINFESYLQYLCNFNHYQSPNNVEAALRLYFNLLPVI